MKLSYLLFLILILLVYACSSTRHEGVYVSEHATLELKCDGSFLKTCRYSHDTIIGQWSMEKGDIMLVGYRDCGEKKEAIQFFVIGTFGGLSLVKDANNSQRNYNLERKIKCPD